MDDSSPTVEHEVRRSIKRWILNLFDHLIAFELLDNLSYFLEISPQQDFTFKAPFGAQNSRVARFEGGICRDQHAYAYTALLINLFI